MSANKDDKPSLAEAIQRNDQPVLVDFWAPWCPPCRAMMPVVDELAEDVAGQATVVKANVEDYIREAADFGVEAIPAFVVIKDGEVKDQLSGVFSKEKLREALEPYLDKE